ncbi:glutamic acid-rich protein isoform X2 [Maniola jurtina]|uniref:glutamic acid-rich protein isoform X2 n=2 Tax=Maniola jurtina TaxID=191418 RepID=UPI001E68E582|nr:glutamic acid-rich protein isoform X2 [Maniola jurtina]
MASTAVKVAGAAKDISPLYYRILSKFPQNFTFCFAYGSAVKPQIGNQKKHNMIDLIYCVDNSYRWHGANIDINPSHYSALRFLGKGFVARFQEKWGAKVYFNTLVDIKEENVTIKYGVVSQKDLIADLLDWNHLYLAGRLHKPVEIIKKTNSSQLQIALQSNLRSAVHTALLVLPETFSEYDFYFTISNLSYAGDFRMTFGENKNKVRNIVQPQLLNFRELYRPILQQFHAYVDFPTGDAQCHQDIHPETKLHHLMQLPMVPQQRIVKFWNHGGLQQDMEDVLRAVAYDIDCAVILRQILKDLVWQSSVRQSLKGIPTAGFLKSIRTNMLTDESSSDSETGRFKGQTKSQDDKSISTNLKRDSLLNRSTGRNRSFPDRFNRDADRRRSEREKFERRSRERNRYSRYSPRRRHSRERSKISSERFRDRHRRDSRSREKKSKPRETRSNSKDRHRHSRSRSHKSPVKTRNIRDEIKGIITKKDRSPDKVLKKSRNENLSSPEPVAKKSVVHKPTEVQRKKSESPILIEEHASSDVSEEVQPGSYYNMIPAIVKEKPDEVKGKSEESSEIDSSDDERLRAKLLNLEKELQKTKKKKHKKKHKRKNSKSDKDKRDSSASVEVTSTTDIPELMTESSKVIESAEVTSTQKMKESSEEGEILSDDSQSDIDPNDLRHKLKRSKKAPDFQKKDACGPALPPHLERRFKKSTSPVIEGPSLPPHLQKKGHNIGPSIPEDMRKVLAENSDMTHEVIHSSSDDDGIGPLPTGAEHKWSEAHQRLEERAIVMKIQTLDGRSLKSSNIKTREQWMLELPEGKAKYLGLEARSFRAKEGPDMSDRSSWTDTPEDKVRKALGMPKEEDSSTTLQREARDRHIASRDEEQEKAARKHKKKHKREESLLEIHQKKLKKKKKKEDKDEEKKERRPFSRDQDLQINRFDEAQKKSIIKKAQGLNSRFSSGEAKYL